MKYPTVEMITKCPRAEFPPLSAINAYPQACKIRDMAGEPFEFLWEPGKYLIFLCKEEPRFNYTEFFFPCWWNHWGCTFEGFLYVPIRDLDRVLQRLKERK